MTDVDAASRERQEKIVLAVVTTTSFLTPFMGSAINMAIPAIGREYSAGALHLGWIVTSYLLASAAFLLPVGRLADVIGRKKIYVAGIIGFALFTLLCAQAWSINALIFFRVLQGAASAMIFATGMAILTSIYSPQKRGRALGITVAGVYLGLSLGPVLGGILNHQLGWRSIFYFTFALSLYAAFLAAARLKTQPEETVGEKFDVVGSILCIIGLTAVLYGLASVTTVPAAKYVGVAGIFVLFLFVRYESRIEFPIIKVKLFVNNTGFTFSNLAAMINYSATYAIGFIISLYLQIIKGYTSQTAGIIMLSQPIIMTLLSPLAGALSDRVEPRIVASWGMSITTLGLFFFIFLSPTTSIAIVIANLALLGLGFALFSSPNNNAIMSSVPPVFYGVASSMLGTVRLVGQAISMAAVTLVMAMFIGNAGLSAAAAPGLLRASHVAYIIFTIICLAGIFASLARGDIITDQQPE